MNLSLALQELYPAGTAGVDYEVVDLSDGAGPKITKWNEALLGLRPTASALAHAWLVAVKRLKKNELSKRMHADNRALYPELSRVEGAWVAEAMLDLINAPQGPRITAMKANRDKRVRGYAAVDAASTPEAVESVTWEAA